MLISKFLNLILNLGTTENDDVNLVRLYRQVNGLSVFYIFVAFSVGFICFVFLRNTKGTFYLGIIQIIATFMYLTILLMTARRKINFSRQMVINTFEWHLFFIGLLLNGWGGPILPVVILYPLLAALVEVSIIKHLFIGLLQISIFLIIKFIFPNIQNFLISFSGINEGVSNILSIMSYSYFPVMAAIIIRIIFKENMRARQKQKELLSEIQISNNLLEIYTERLKDESMRLQAEVNIAKRIQKMVLPSDEEIQEIKELDIACFMQSAKEVGGDYYDILQKDDTILIGIGDVTDHGLVAGLVMLMAQTSIRTCFEENIFDSKQIISLVNKTLQKNINRIKEDKNMTLSIINYNKGALSISGQHESIVICRANGEIEIYDTIENGFYVGLLPDIDNLLNTVNLNFQKNDILFLYTDGLTEADNNKKEQFGLDRACSVLKKYKDLSSNEIKFKIIKELYNFIGIKEFDDDITIIVIKKK